VEESSLAATPEGFWTTEAECRPREVEYIAVVDQNSRSLAYFRFELSSSAADPDSQKRRKTRPTAQKREHGETHRSNIRLLHDYFDFFQRLFIAIFRYLAMVWQRGFARPLGTHNTVQVRLFRHVCGLFV
jgi:hypothetical protein